MIIIISTTNCLDKYKHQFKQYRVFTVFRFRIYVFYVDAN